MPFLGGRASVAGPWHSGASELGLDLASHAAPRTPVVRGLRAGASVGGAQQGIPRSRRPLRIRARPRRDAERVKQLDAMARAGGHAQRMDWIAHEHKTARDRQFRLPCLVATGQQKCGCSDLRPSLNVAQYFANFQLRA